MTPFHRLDCGGLLAAYRSGADPRAVVDHYLDRIDRFDPALRAFVALDRDGARAAAAASAERWAANRPLPLDGVPIAVKANIDVAGLPTNAGIGAFRDAVAASDAEVVRRLRAAGAVVLGNLNMHEAALGATTDNVFFGRTINPHAEGYTPGGSSGGSGAAVAAGLCAAALGTDTLGSVRIPAAYNGVYGLKPTNGLVRDDGLVFLVPRLDCIGPLARSVGDLALLLGVMASAPAAEPIRRVAVPSLALDADLDPAVAKSLPLAESLLKGLGIAVDHVRLDLDPHRIRLSGFVEAAREAEARFGPDMARDPAGFGEAFKSYLDFAGRFDEAAVVQARRTLDEAAVALHASLATADAMLLPTTPQPAFPHDDAAPVSQADFTALANIAGLPALALPAGWTSRGLPVGVQLMGRAGSERALIDLSARLDATLGGYAPPPAYA